MARLLLTTLIPLLFGAALAVPSARATVFYALDEVPALAFPEATRSEVRNLFLGPAERARIERAIGKELESGLISVHLGWRDNELLGYAMLDTHLVRTLPEAFLVVLDTDGRIRGTHILAFYEPLEYMPSERWLAKFGGETLHSELRLGRNITAITGSTLSSAAVLGGIRRALALHAELVVRSGRLPR